MNLYNEDEKRDGAPVIPSGASSFKKSSAFGKPMFSRTAGGIMERLKNLSRKDMAFVGIGLSVLVMAPVAEYMTSKPSTDNLLTPGFGSREGSSASGGVYEPGINALSQGSPDGSGEVITPLSSRDPSSLILGAQPAQPVMPPVTAPPPSSNFRDSMKDVGRNAFSEAAKSVGAPTPIPRMQSALRNFGSFFSGGEGTRTGGTLGGGKIIDDAKSASSRAAGRSMVGPVATAGYKGVASNSPHGSSGSAFDKLRSQADRAASNFSGTSAMNSLDKAAADSVNIGAGAGGLGAGGSDSEKTGKPSNSTTKYDHSRSGESLEEMAAKQRMQKALDWEFFKQYEIPKQIITAIVGAVSTSIGKFVGGAMDDVLNPSSPAAKCWVPNLTDASMIAKITKDNYGNPEGYLNSLCGALGSTQLITSVGDKAATGYQNRCECGRGGKPDYPKGPVSPLGGGSQGGNNVAPGQGPGAGSNVNAKEFDEYKRILQTMVTKTAEVQADPKKAETIVPNIGDNFGDLQKNVNGTSKEVMRNLLAAAGKSFDEYSGKVDSAQKKYSELKPKYEAFVDQIAAISSDAAKGHIANENKGQVKGFNVKASIDDQKTIDSIKSIIQVWNTSGVPSYEGSVLRLQLNAQWLPAYTRQLGAVRTGQEAIFSKQAKINDAVAAAVKETDQVKKLKLLTGQEVAPANPPSGTDATGVKKEAAASADDQQGGPVPLVSAAGLYGAALVWKSPYEPSSKDIISNESAKWETWNGSPSSDDGALGPVDSLITNQMRSNEISAAVKSRIPDPAEIEAEFTRIQALIGTTQNQLTGIGVSSSYFGGTPVAQKPEDEKPKPDQPKPDQPKPDQPKPDQPKPDQPKPTVNPNAPSEEQVKKAETYKEILEDCHKYGVGKDDGAIHCSVDQSAIIKQATEGAAVDRVGTSSLTKRDIVTLRGNVVHACAALAQCNKKGYEAANCFSK